jgi:hypothetical protein
MSVEAPALVPNVIPFHCPGAESELDVKTMWLPLVPDAEREPLIVSVRDVELPCTVTPGSIVSVTPELTVTFPVITYGLPAAVQVVFEEIVPETFVAPAGCGWERRRRARARARRDAALRLGRPSSSDARAEEPGMVPPWDWSSPPGAQPWSRRPRR